MGVGGGGAAGGKMLGLPGGGGMSYVYWSGGPALTLTLTYAPARARMARPWSAGCYGVARHREGSRQNSRRGSGVLSFPPFGPGPFIPFPPCCPTILRRAIYLYWFPPSPPLPP